MSEKKLDKGKWYHKLHQLQKRVTRWLKNGEVDKVEEAKKRELKIIDKLKHK